MSDIIQADDLLIQRDRFSRTALFLTTPVVLAILGGLLVGGLASVFLTAEAFFWIGLVIGAAAGVIAFLNIKHLFVVQNDTTGLLVNIDQLQSLLGRKNVNVVYGPGTHFCFPWEARFAKNNIPIEEVAEDFNFTAICKDGTVTGTGSIRLRPDFARPINYLSGVGAVGKDLRDLVVAFITDWLASRTMSTAVELKSELNSALHDRFVAGLSGFEERFGVRLGDITVSELRLSADVEKTRNAINEAEVVAKGSAILLGFKTVAKMQAALQAKTITQDDIDRARREFRIISGNMDGASINRYEVDIKGLTPEVAAAIASFLKQNPGAASSAARTASRAKTTKAKTP